jgi:hypothetical protein
MFNCKKFPKLHIRPPSLILLMVHPRIGEYFPAKAEKWEIRIIIIIIMRLLSLSLHCKGALRQKSYSSREITCLLLRGETLAGCCRVSHTASLRVWIVSGFMPVIRTTACPDHRKKTEGYRWPIKCSDYPGIRLTDRQLYYISSCM